MIYACDAPLRRWPVIGSNRGEYGSRYRSKEDDIVQELGAIFGPYTGRCFGSTSDTHIEHMVALHQAHHSGLCTADTETKRTFAGDLLNLTLAAPEVNRQKGSRDAAGWMPTLARESYCRGQTQVRADRGQSRGGRVGGRTGYVFEHGTRHPGMCGVTVDREA